MASISTDDVSVALGGDVPEAVPDEVAEMFALDKKKKKKKPKKVSACHDFASAPCPLIRFRRFHRQMTWHRRERRRHRAANWAT